MNKMRKGAVESALIIAILSLLSGIFLEKEVSVAHHFYLEDGNITREIK